MKIGNSNLCLVNVHDLKVLGKLDVMVTQKCMDIKSCKPIQTSCVDNLPQVYELIISNCIFKQGMRSKPPIPGERLQGRPNLTKQTSTEKQLQR